VAKTKNALDLQWKIEGV